MNKKIILTISICLFFIWNPIVTNAQKNSLTNNFTPNYNKSTVMIEMRDGVNLATDIYLPDFIGEGSRAVILIRTPYNKDGLSIFATIFTSLRGYITISQDMRGRFASEGTDMVFQNASTDAFDTIQWILTQSWCNGKIGTYGASALGINQFFMHLANPPGLTAQAIQIASPDFYRDVLYPGGAFRLALVEGWLSSIGSSFWLPLIYENENFTHLWNNVTLVNKYDQVNTPGVFQAGWFDVFSQGTIDGFMGYQYNSSESTKGKSFLVIGPWGHGTYFDRTQGEITFPSNAIDDLYSPLMYDFFEYYLKEQQNGLYSQSTVRYYCMGPDSAGSLGNFWRSSSNWPIPVNYTKFYLRDGGLISKDLPDGNEEADNFYYDPNNPVPTIGGGNLNIAFGPHDQTSLESREDVIIFSSDTIIEPLEITGEMKAHLWVSSNCSDTDFTVKITDLYPDGRSMLIQDGIVRAKYRSNNTSPELLTPGEIVEVEINLWSTSYIFNEGHKIRIAISSSNYPRFNANPNNGAPIFTNNQTYIANNTIYHNSSHPSHIIFPINSNGTYPEETTTPSSPASMKSIFILSVFFLIPICHSIIRKYNQKKKNY
ncbi:MAG: CocE/NonD family hydrolase [Asgard group archaeon]|nr:CocE/NonD family hydrolase [Asgard group archaeon]